MEVVLLENIKNLGKIGDVVNVKRGHGRNFLIKYGKALKASQENIDLVNKKKIELNEKIDESLIGGLVLRMGSTMIDSSIKTKLSTLKMIMKGV